MPINFDSAPQEDGSAHLRANGWGDRAPLRSEPRTEPKADAKAAAPATAEGTLALQLSETLVNLIEFGDPYYRGGTALTRLVAESVCDHFFVEGQERQNVLLAAVLRDLGRLLLQSRGQLPPMSQPTPQAQEMIRRHVPLGLDLLEGVDLPPEVRLIIRHHHERWDGAGYPDGLAREEIPLGARILGVADSIASMLRPRPYRLPRRFSHVAEELKRESGRQFDPTIVSAITHILQAGGFRLLGLGERQHVIIAPPAPDRGDVFAIRLSRLGYLGEVRALDEVRDRALRVPVEAVILCYASDPIGCNRLIEEMRRTPALNDTTILVVDAPDPPSRGHALAAGADCALGAVDFETVQQVLSAMISQSVRLRGDVTGDPEVPIPAMTGRLEDFGVDWLLQWLNYNAATAAIDLDHRGVRGTIWMVGGEPHDARLGQVVGTEAIRHLLGWPTGRFSLRMGDKSTTRTIESSLVTVLLRYAAEGEGQAVLYGAVEGGG